MSNSFKRILKIAEIILKSDDIKELNKFLVYLNAYIKRHAHESNSDDDDFWKKNMDYDVKNSPYFGSINEFMKKFPGGIKEWLKWRNKEGCFKIISSENDKTIHKLLDRMLDFGIITEKQKADDASLKATNDVINYWKLLLKKHKRNK